MNDQIITQLQFFGISILWGSLILLVYDGLRIFRRLIKQGSLLLAIEDIIFWVIASVFIFAMIYKENDGIIRGFSVMGMTIGMVLYHYIVSEFLVSMITKLIQILLTPLVMVIKVVKQFLHFLAVSVKKALKFTIRQLNKWMKSVKIAMGVRRQASAVKRKTKADQKNLQQTKTKDKDIHSLKTKKIMKTKKVKKPRNK